MKSLTLVHGAFSHFTFTEHLPFDARRPGGLAGLADRVDGPLLATFTDADRAVGRWYPLASMLSGQDAQGTASLTYRWGAMGHDGYQVNPAATVVALQQAGTPYAFAKGAFYALDSNTVICADQSPISGAHSDIRHPQIAWAVACAARLAAADPPTH